MADELDVLSWAARRPGEKEYAPRAASLRWVDIHAGARSVLDVTKDGELVGFKTISLLTHDRLHAATASPSSTLSYRARGVLHALIAHIHWGKHDDVHRKWGPHHVWADQERLRSMAGFKDRKSVSDGVQELLTRKLVVVFQGDGIGKGLNYVVQVDNVLALAPPARRKPAKGDESGS